MNSALIEAWAFEDIAFDELPEWAVEMIHDTFEALTAQRSIDECNYRFAQFAASQMDTIWHDGKDAGYEAGHAAGLQDAPKQLSLFDNDTEAD